MRKGFGVVLGSNFASWYRPLELIDSSMLEALRLLQAGAVTAATSQLDQARKAKKAIEEALRALK
jgi:hypothetical protein